MALGSFVAGRASATYDPAGAAVAADLGIMEEGYNISLDVAKELIQETDAYGQMVVDAIYRGIANVFIEATAIEWKNGLLAAVTPYQALAASGATYLGPGVIGRLDSDVAGILILTATAGTPAAAAPATLTATYTIFSESFPLRWAVNSKLRKMPFRFRLLAYLDTVIKHFTCT